MPNGRALPTTLLFDALLGDAWGKALISYANANGLSQPSIQPALAVDGSFGMPGLPPPFSGSAAGAVATHDRALTAQLQAVSQAWSTEFEGVMNLVAPVGPGFHLAVRWLRDVANGQDKLGYLGQDHRNNQAQGYAAMARGAINPRGLFLPSGAAPALMAVSDRVAGLHLDRLSAQMTADRAAELHKMRVDGVEILVKLRNEALDAAMDLMFSQASLMFDVFGSNNDYLTALRRDEQAMRDRVQVRSAHLQSWDAQMRVNFDGAQERVRKVNAINDRSMEKGGLTVEQHVKRVRRFASQAMAALNSAGVSVNSSAQESNQVDAEQ